MPEAETECSHPATVHERRVIAAMSAAPSCEVTTNSGCASFRMPVSTLSTRSWGTALHQTPFHRYRTSPAAVPVAAGERVGGPERDILPEPAASQASGRLADGEVVGMTGHGGRCDQLGVLHPVQHLRELGGDLRHLSRPGRPVGLLRILAPKPDAGSAQG